MPRTALPVRALPFILLAALACSTLSVSVDYDPDQNFSGYHTYAWLPDTPEATGHPRLDSPMVQERVRKGIDRALAAKGFTLTAEKPDFYVTYQLAVDRKLDVRTIDQGFYGRYGYRVSMPETTVSQYDEGSLIIDVADARAKKVVWRGVGSKRLRSTSGTQDPAELQQRVFQVVDEVLAGFPPKKKS